MLGLCTLGFVPRRLEPQGEVIWSMTKVGFGGETVGDKHVCCRAQIMSILAISRDLLLSSFTLMPRNNVRKEKQQLARVISQ